MDDCKHPRVQNFKFADGAAAPLWGCVDCSHKFVPINLPMEQDAERYRYLRNRRPADVLNVSGPAAGCWIDCEGGEDKPYPLMLLTGADADAAIDAVMVAAPAVVLPNA